MNLKNTVEEQIDVILKLEDQRKALLKENKVYKEKNKELTVLLNKYNFKANTIQSETQTDTLGLQQSSAQTDIEPQAVSQLDEAKELLSCLNKTQLKIGIEKEKLQQSSLQILQTTSRKQNNNSFSNEQMFSSQLIKMTKEINSLRKDLKDALKIVKTKQQQSKQLKKCLDLKTDLLEKARTDFNDLSKLVNTDKYKSVRILEQETSKCKQGLKAATEENKLLRFEQEKVHSLNDKLRSTLQKLAGEYQTYKQAGERQKQEQTQTIQTMRTLTEKYKQQAKQYQKNQKHLLESIRRCQCRIQ